MEKYKSKFKESLESFLSKLPNYIKIDFENENYANGFIRRFEDFITDVQYGSYILEIDTDFILPYLENFKVDFKTYDSTDDFLDIEILLDLKSEKFINEVFKYFKFIKNEKAKQQLLTLLAGYIVSEEKFSKALVKYIGSSDIRITEVIFYGFRIEKNIWSKTQNKSFIINIS